MILSFVTGSGKATEPWPARGGVTTRNPAAKFFVRKRLGDFQSLADRTSLKAF